MWRGERGRGGKDGRGGIDGKEEEKDQLDGACEFSSVEN